MSGKCCNMHNNNSHNPLTSRRTDGGKKRLSLIICIKKKKMKKILKTLVPNFRVFHNLTLFISGAKNAEIGARVLAESQLV